MFLILHSPYGGMVESKNFYIEGKISENLGWETNRILPKTRQNYCSGSSTIAFFFSALKAREPIYNKNRIASGYTAHERTSVFWGQLPYPAIKPDFKLEVMDRL